MEKGHGFDARPPDAEPTTRHHHLQHHSEGLYPSQSLEIGCAHARLMEKGAIRISARCSQLHIFAGLSERSRWKLGEGFVHVCPHNKFGCR